MKEQVRSQAQLWEYLGGILEESNGEISEEFEQEIKRLETNTQDCLACLLYLIRKSDREADSYKAEQAHFQAKAKKKEAQRDYFRSLMQTLMLSAGLKNFKSTLGSVGVSEPTGTNKKIPDVMALPVDYRTSEIVWKAEKDLIDQAFANGYKVPGVIEEPRQPYLTVRLS